MTSWVAARVGRWPPRPFGSRALGRVSETAEALRGSVLGEMKGEDVGSS